MSPIITSQVRPIMIFADGASSGNPGPGGWGAIVLTPNHQVHELGGAEAHTTNNRMELRAVIEALKFVQDQRGEIEVYTDSTYVIKGVTQWSYNWKRNDWKTGEGKEVANQELWKDLLELDDQRKVHWKYVRGHAGIPGNERADSIAVSYSKQIPFRLYQGPFENYSVALLELKESERKTNSNNKLSNKSKSSGPAYSYLSVVGGTPQRHHSWAECENRVRGQSGARFKKALSLEDEDLILKSWGFKPEDIDQKKE